MEFRTKGQLMLKVMSTCVAIGMVSLCGVARADAPIITQISYDRGDHISQVTDPRGLVTTYATDGLGQRWQQTSPDIGTTTFSYDGNGRLSSMTRADGSQTTYGYDAIGRRNTVSAGGLTQTWAYDNCTNGIGRLCSASDAAGTTSYSYTPEGWLAGRGFSMGGTTYALGYSYNALGKITTVVYPDNNRAIYTYTNGVVSAVQVNIGGATYNAATGISYQPGGGVVSSWTSSNGLSNSLSYDTDGRLTGMTVQGVQSLSFAYDAASRLTQITNGSDGAMTQNFGYDAQSHLAWVVASADNESFQYDANGNRIYQVLNGTAATVTPNGANNQIASLSGGSNVSYGYDARGNLTTVSGTPTFAYDAFNRLSSAPNATYYVNPEGQRLRKTVSGTSTYFAPDSAGSLLAENSASGWSDYVWLNGRLIGRINGGQLLAIHADQVGRPEAMTDSSGTVVWRARNFAFDRTVTVTNAVPLNLGFPGQYFDAESGLWNNGFRDYSPSLGRYIESDPTGLIAGINTYAYVGSNPLSFVDMTGLCKCKPVPAILTAVGGSQATADGALYSKYPAESGGSIKGGTNGTVAVQRGFLGLSTRQLRMYGTQITITPSNQSAITRYGGPAGALTVSDYGDTNIQNRSGLAFDIYRFPTTDDGNKFGNQTMDVTIEFPDDVPAKCPTAG